jgi:DNA-binding CsgD family transcriptional regulator
MYGIESSLRPVGVNSKHRSTPVLGALSKFDRESLPVDNLSPSLGDCLLHALEGLSQGMALFTIHSRLLYANSAADLILNEAYWRRENGVVGSSNLIEREAWFRALRLAVKNKNISLLEMSRKEGSVFVATMPIQANGEILVLANFGPLDLSPTAALQLFAKHHRLTGAEIGVLEKLAKGVKPAQIAALHRVKLSTINSQLATLRAKTGCASSNELLVKLSRLPALRSIRNSEKALICLGDSGPF